jgi:hypothetical protein
MKRKLFLLSLIAFVLAFAIAGCQREGCTDSKATNYDPDAKKDNGTCVYATPGPEPTPVIPTKEIVLDWDWNTPINTTINVKEIENLAKQEDVKFIFLNLINEDNGELSSGFSTNVFRTVRDSLQTRFDISPKVRGSGIIYVHPEIGAQIPDGTFGTGMNIIDSVWFADKGYQIKRYDPSAQ